MYLVFSKESDSLIHKNNAPVGSLKTEKEVYYMFDEKSHYIIEYDGELSEHYEIITEEKSEKKIIKTLSENEKYERGILQPPEFHKWDGEKLVQQTVKEMVDAGNIDIEEIRTQQMFEIFEQYKSKAMMRIVYERLNADFKEEIEQKMAELSAAKTFEEIVSVNSPDFYFDLKEDRHLRKQDVGDRDVPFVGEFLKAQVKEQVE